MNSGVFCLYMMLTFSVLFVSGWGGRYVAESGVNQKLWALFLFLNGALATISLPIKGIQVNLSAALYLFGLLVYFLFMQGIGNKLKFMLMIVTTASVGFTLMVVVPHEPVFYFVEEKYLYPLSAVCASYLFSRKPLLTAAAASGGIMAAGVLVENKNILPYTGTFSFGSQDIMEMIVISLTLSYLMDKAVTVTEMFLSWIQGNRPEDLESDPT